MIKTVHITKKSVMKYYVDVWMDNMDGLSTYEIKYNGQIIEISYDVMGPFHAGVTLIPKNKGFLKKEVFLLTWMRGGNEDAEYYDGENPVASKHAINGKWSDVKNFMEAIVTAYESITDENTE